jgi:sugar lactone lactonase YvrE
MLPVRPGLAVPLAFACCLFLQVSMHSTPGTDWRVGDLFVSSVGMASKGATLSGEYAVFAADGTPRGESVGRMLRSGTAGCAVDVDSGYLWAAGFDGNTVSRYEDVHNALLQHGLLDSVAVRALTFVNGRARGAVQSIGFDAAGFAYAGTTNGTNLLLKFNGSGALVDTFTLPGGSKGMARFDIAGDQRTVYYTSGVPGDGNVRRYDLATRAALPDFAALIDGSVHALRVLPNEGGVLVAGSVGITRLDMHGQYVTRHWLPGVSFTSLNITPDGREFWTSTTLNQLYKFDIATGTVVLGPIQAAPDVNGLCVKMEYTAAENICREADGTGEPVQVACPSL